MIGKSFPESLQPFFSILPLIVIHKDGSAVVEIGLEVVQHQIYLLIEILRRLVCMSFFYREFCSDINDFAVVLLGNCVDDFASFIELTIKHLLSSQEDLRINTIRMHIDGCLNGLIGFGILLASHVVFGNIRQLICLHIRHLTFRDCLFIMMEQPEKVP